MNLTEANNLIRQLGEENKKRPIFLKNEHFHHTQNIHIIGSIFDVVTRTYDREVCAGRVEQAVSHEKCCSE